MNTDDHQCPVFPFLYDLTVFSATVTVCILFLVAACSFTPPCEWMSSGRLSPVTSMPGQPLAWRSDPASDPSEEEVTLAEDESLADQVAALVRDPIPFHGIIMEVAERYEVDPDLVRAIIFAESGYNPRATSKKGARGLMQLMPSTAKALGVEDIYDPQENIDGGVRYFRTLLDRFDGDVQLALAAYNAGSRHVHNYEGVPPFKATRHYIKKVLRFHKKFKMETTTGLHRLV